MKQKLNFNLCLFAGIVIFAACSWMANNIVMAQNKEEIESIIQRLDDQSKVFVAVSQKVTPSVVHISISKKVKMGSQEQDPFQDFFGDEFFRRFFRDRMPSPKDRDGKEREYRQQGMGSGVIINSQGYILSNNHVVRDADKVVVKLDDKREFEAKVVGGDEKTDIAVLKIEGSGFPYADLGDSDNIAVGQWVLAIGNPFGLSQTVTAGIISAKGRSHVGIADYEDFIQTDAAINPGNSGGPLVNLRGQVIGINTAIVSRSGGYQGIGFAIPVNMAKSVMDQIISKGKVVRGWLGVQIQEITQDLARSFNLKNVEGALVTDVAKGSPAEKGGMKQGDIILSYNGIPIRNSSHLRNMVAATTIGQTVPMEISRDGVAMTLQILIGDLSKANWEGISGLEGEEKSGIAELGMELKELTPELAQKYGYRADSFGLLIVSISQESPLASYGLKTGDLIVSINRIAIRTIADFKKALDRDNNRILLLVYTKNGHRYLAIPKPK